MGDLFRVRAGWTASLAGAPYLTTLYFGTGLYVEQDCVDAAGAFFDDLTDFFANDCTVTIEPDVAIIDDVTGTLVGMTGTTPPGPYTGVNTNSVAPTASQGLIRWGTGDVVGGRLLRGHTFVPAPTLDYNNNGVPNSTYVTGLAAAGQGLIDDVGSELRVWSRTHGASALVTSSSAANYWAVLRSRRD